MKAGFLVAGALCAFQPTLVMASTNAPTPAQMSSARTNGLAWLFKTQNGDGGWSNKAGLQVQSTSAVLDAFRNSGIKSGSAFYAGVANLSNAQPSSTDGRARQIDALYSAGQDVRVLIAQLQKQSTQYSFGASASTYKAWGTVPGYSASVADTALAVTALIDSSVGYVDYKNTLCGIFLAANRSNGWSYAMPAVGAPSSTPNVSVIPTAYTLLALQKIAGLGYTTYTCPGASTQNNISSLITPAINYLVSRQNTDGGWGEFLPASLLPASGTGTASATLETALALRAIQTVQAPDAPTLSAIDKAQAFLISSQKSNGSWAEDPFQTALALQTFAPTTLVNTANDGIPDVVKTALGIPNTSVPTRGVRTGNGSGVQGATIPTGVPGAIVGVPYSYAFIGGSYSYSLVSGQLPDGLDLSAGGLVTGTPTVAGPFSFTLGQTDSNGAVSYLTAQIQVDLDAADTPTLPQWAAILMGGLLLITALSQGRHRH
jgi:hypothetical protein